MADLLARFKIIDEMSEKLANIAECGQSMLNQIEQAGIAASAAFDGMSGTAVTTATSVDGIATSVNEIQNAAGNALGSAENLTSAVDSFCATAEQAASQTDYWTDAVGNYDKSALEAVYSLEELVDMGYKSTEALEEQNNMIALCEQETDHLSMAMESAVDIQSELSKAIEESGSIVEKAAERDRISTESKAELERACSTASIAMKELASAQAAAEAATENCNAVMRSGTASLEEMEAAAVQACEAAEGLAAANEKADAATEELTKASQDASESMEDSGKKGVDAFEAISSALAAAGITKTLKEMSEASYELADAFSESEQIVVNATGATGDTLAGLESSMMDAFSGNYQSLDTVAGAIGEINTRMGLTEETLTGVTDQFLDYATITGSDVVGSVQNVTKVMNKWNVEAEDLESVLDKLAYAGQISGASVDDLSGTLISGAASFQSMGLSLDNVISMLSDFELAGISSSSAVTAIRTAVNNFAEDGIYAQTGLQSVITEMQNMESTSEATALAVETFGSRAGQEFALAIQNGTLSIDTFTATLDKAEGTLQSTAKAGETLSQKWQESTNKIKAAFTEALRPSLETVSDGLADATGKIGDFLDEHPAATAAITGVATALGIAAAGVAAVTFATTVAIPAITAFGSAINLALGPVGWIAIGLTAVVGGITAVTAAFSAGEEEIEDYSGTLAQCADEISRTEAAYEKACEMYGSNSDAAHELEEQLETLNAQYEKGGGYLADLAQQSNNAAAEILELSDRLNDTYEELDHTQSGGFQNVVMLEELSKKAEKSNTDLQLMQQYADYLNDTFNCNIEVTTSGEVNNFDMSGIIDKINDQIVENKATAAVEFLADPDISGNYAEEYQALQKMQEEYNLLQAGFEQYEAMNAIGDTEGIRLWEDAMAEAFENAGYGYAQLAQYSDKIQSELDEQENKLADATSEIEKNAEMAGMDAASTQEMLNGWLESSGAIDKLNDSIETSITRSEQAAEGVEKVTGIMEDYTDEILELCQAYDDAYNAAYESFSGQFGLFDEASTESETYMESTVANAQAALDSQLAYWESYNSNISVLKDTSAEDLGITQENYDALMSYVQSGSEEAAGLAASMVSELEHGHEDSIIELANTIGEIDSSQQEIAQMTAEWQTGLDAAMQGIIDRMEAGVEGLNLSGPAKISGDKTMGSYIESLEAAKGRAVSAAQSVVSAVQSVFNSASLSYSIDDASGSVTVAGHATGTTNAEDIFIAGEEGPELIVGKAGSTVFPTSETEKILRAFDGMQTEVSPMIGDQITNYDESINYGESRIFGSSQTYDTIYGNSSDRAYEATYQAGDFNNITYTTASNKNDDIASVIYPSLELLSAMLERVYEMNFDLPESNFENAIKDNTQYSYEYTGFRFNEDSNDYESMPLYVTQDETPDFSKDDNNSNSHEITKRIILEVDGSGSINISGGVTEEEVLELLQNHLKPELMRIIRSEIYEEGDLSYEF